MERKRCLPLRATVTDGIRAQAICAAVNQRLRSANRGNSNNVWNVNSGGNLNNNNANNSYRSLPDCVKHEAAAKTATHSEAGRWRH